MEPCGTPHVVFTIISDFNVLCPIFRVTSKPGKIFTLNVIIFELF